MKYNVHDYVFIYKFDVYTLFNFTSTIIIRVHLKFTFIFFFNFYFKKMINY